MRAFKVSNEKNEIEAIFWWDGETIRSSSPNWLKTLKEQYVNGLDFGDGKEFFKAIPRIFSSGYLHTEPAEVDKDGKLV